jgi:selenocysteine lyase/cysteine desulfurase
LEEKFIKTCKDSSVALIKRGDFIRVSIHAFNSEEEVDRVLDLLRLNQIS